MRVKAELTSSSVPMCPILSVRAGREAQRECPQGPMPYISTSAGRVCLETDGAAQHVSGCQVCGVTC